MTALVALKRLTIYTGCCVRFPASIFVNGCLGIDSKTKMYCLFSLFSKSCTVRGLRIDSFH
ncbi:hypothetical protein I3842_14G017000 [Carya illinoinensis]|uniref:Uncharacterized protein n=1 Tax=Carya illinoinensis TaxID=32201 RepID=A0A922D3C5_CARIL|nr:hypothetical protein I3842_14G017000 [Carya illinoinensis]